MGGAFDETTLHSGKKAKLRNREQIIVLAVSNLSAASGNGFADLSEVLNEAQRYEISGDIAEKIIDKMVGQGRLYRPKGYNTLAVS